MGRTRDPQQLAVADSVRTLLDKEAIRDLLSRYLFLTDLNLVTERAELFTEDCRFDVHGVEVHGREATKTMKADVPEGTLRPVKHFTVNSVIDLNGDEARVESQLLMVQAPDDGTIRTVVAGRYEDVVVKQHGRWLFHVRIAHRELLAKP